MDEEFWAKLYKDNYVRLYKEIYMIANNEDVASEIVSETFSKAINRALSFEQYEHPYAALRKAAYRTYYKKKAREKKELLKFKEYYELYCYTTQDDFIEILSVRLESKTLTKALTQLSFSDQQLLYLKYILDLSFVEIADLLGVKYRTLITRHRSATGKLRFYLTGHTGPAVRTDLHLDEKQKPKSKFYVFMLYLLYIIKG